MLTAGVEGHTGRVGWFGRKKREARVAKEAKHVPDALLAHLNEFVLNRRGVEAWVEQPTSFNKPSLLLIAHDGESTRRAVPSADYAHDFAASHSIPCYDAGVVPYPKRFRDYSLRQKRAQS